MGKDRAKKPPEIVLAENYSRLRDKKKAEGLWKGPGVAPKTANNVEKARHNTKLSTLVDIAKACGVDAYQLLIPVEDENFLAVMRAWAQSDDQGKDNLYVIAEAMLKRLEGQDEARSAPTVVHRKRDRTG